MEGIQNEPSVSIAWESRDQESVERGIVTYAGENVGVVRIQRDDDAKEITLRHYGIDEKFHGRKEGAQKRSLGELVLRTIIRSFPGYTIHASVEAQNVASCISLQRAGFARLSESGGTIAYQFLPPTAGAQND